MHVITLLNEKGGVGKTTTATHAAAGLAVRGYRVMLVDTDPQGNAAIIMGLAKEAGLYNLLVRRERWQDVMRPIPAAFYTREGRENNGELWLLPSNVETRAIPSIVDDVTLFGRRLAELRDHIDVVIIDTPPTPSMLHGSAYLATDFLIYPTLCQLLSFDGLAESMARLDDISNARTRFSLPAINVLGIIPTQYRAQTVDQSENLRELKERFGDLVWEPIANRTAWSEATTAGQLVWMDDDHYQATAEIERVIDRIEKVLTHVG